MNIVIQEIQFCDTETTIKVKNPKIWPQTHFATLVDMLFDVMMNDLSGSKTFSNLSSNKLDNLKCIDLEWIRLGWDQKNLPGSLRY